MSYHSGEIVEKVQQELLGCSSKKQLISCLLRSVGRQFYGSASVFYLAPGVSPVTLPPLLWSGKSGKKRRNSEDAKILEAVKFLYSRLLESKSAFSVMANKAHSKNDSAYKAFQCGAIYCCAVQDAGRTVGCMILALESHTLEEDLYISICDLVDSSYQQLKKLHYKDKALKQKAKRERSSPEKDLSKEERDSRYTQFRRFRALYRLSHEISRYLTLPELFNAAFLIVREELGLKRLWLGLIDESSAVLVGRAAYGPGWKRPLVELVIPLGNKDHAFKRAIETRKPVILDKPAEVFANFGVKRVAKVFGEQSVGLIPMVVSNHVVGILAVQTSSSAKVLQREELSLLMLFAGEIASVVLTRKLEEQITEADKFRTAALLVGGIAHNFNNLLQSILGQVSLIEFQAGDKQAVRKATKAIHQQSMKGAGMVRELLSITEVAAPFSRSINLEEMLSAAKDKLLSKITPKQNLEIKIIPKLPAFKFDKEQLLKILYLLLENASEASGPQGRIQIFANEVKVNENLEKAVGLPSGSYIALGVRDSGRGMNEDVRRRCFEPFFTTKERDPGTGLGLGGAGLGLTVAYALATRNGALLVAESRSGRGSEFNLFIPLAEKHSDKYKLGVYPGQRSGNAKFESLQ